MRSCDGKGRSRERLQCEANVVSAGGVDLPTGMCLIGAGWYAPMPGTMNSTRAPQMIMKDMSPRSNLCERGDKPRACARMPLSSATHWLVSTEVDRPSKHETWPQIRYARQHSLDRSRRSCWSMLVLGLIYVRELADGRACDPKGERCRMNRGGGREGSRDDSLEPARSTSAERVGECGVGEGEEI